MTAPLIVVPRSCDEIKGDPRPMKDAHTPSVALLIPAYNAQEDVERSIATLSPDDYPVTVVLVDDGSTTPLHPPDPPVPHDLVMLRLERNQGIEAAMNYGLDWILQEGFAYIARLDAGDSVIGPRFRRQVEFLERNPHCMMVGGQARIADPSGQVVAICHYPTRYEEISRVMHYRNCFAHPAVMIRSSVFDEVGRYRYDYPAAEDYDLFYRIAERHCVANLEEFVVQYVADPEGISLTKRRRQLLSGLKIMLEHFDALRYESYLGLAKNLFLLAMPPSINWLIKKNLCSKVGVGKELRQRSR